jgi:hypothetical protein
MDTIKRAAGSTEANRVNQAFSEIEQILAGHNVEIKEMVLMEVKRLRGMVDTVISDETVEDERRANERRDKRRVFIKGLAYIGGDSKKDINKEVQLTKEDLIQIEELGIYCIYTGDNVGAVPMNGDRIRLKFPDGRSGSLYVKDSQRKGFEYGIVKDFRRDEDRAAA